MACTAVSMEPCPVMMATSQRGNSSLSRGRNSSPVMLGIMRSQRTMSGAAVSRQASAASALSASWHSNPAQCPRSCTACECSGDRQRSGTGFSGHQSFLLWLAKKSFHGGNEFLDAKRLFNVRNAGADQRLHGVFIHRIAGDEDESALQLRTMSNNLLVHISSAGAARRPHIRDDPAKMALLVLQQANAFRCGTSSRTGVAASLQRHAHEIHHRALVFNQQERLHHCCGGALVHWRAPLTLVITLRSAFVRTGSLTLKVAPGMS